MSKEQLNTTYLHDYLHCKVALNKSFSFAINDYGELFGWGSNKNGILGEISELAVPYPKSLNNQFKSTSLKILEISAGNDHAACICVSKDRDQWKDGMLFTWGLSLYGRLGQISDDDVDEDEDGMLDYKAISFPVGIGEGVVKVACGYDFTACVTTSGKLYTWGTNKYGNLGIENFTYNSSKQVIKTPTLVTSLTGVVVKQVSCGKNHMLCLSNENFVYSWGSGEFGVLGHGNSSGINKPQIIKELQSEKIVLVSAGDFNSAAISLTGKLFIWGQGKYGRIGIGSLDNQELPQRVVDNGLESQRVSFVSIGFYHTLCCTCKF